MLFVESQFMFVKSEFLLAKSRCVKTLCLLARSHFLLSPNVLLVKSLFLGWLDPPPKKNKPTKKIGSQLLVKPIWRCLVG